MGSRKTSQKERTPGTFGALLTEWRERAGLSQGDVGLALGFSSSSAQSNYSKYERDEHKPKIDRVRFFEELFDVRPRGTLISALLGSATHVPPTLAKNLTPLGTRELDLVNEIAIGLRHIDRDNDAAVQSAVDALLKTFESETKRSGTRS